MKDLTFFVRLLGQNKVEEILEDYVLKNFEKTERKPKVKTAKKKKKNFANGMHYWTPEEEAKLLQLERDYRQEGLVGRKLSVALGKEFGVSYRAAYARLQIIKKQKHGNTAVQPNRERIPVGA